MPPTLSEDDIDDLLYLARTGDADFNTFTSQLCARENAPFADLLIAARDPDTGNAPLHMAAANGHVEILRSSIKVLNGLAPQNPTQLAILNSQNKAGNTALHWAALNGHLECVKVLLEAGADPTITNKAGHDAVFEAELNDKTEVVEWVLKEGEGLESGFGGDGEGEIDRVDGEDEESGKEEKSGMEEVQSSMDKLNTKDKGI